MGIAKNTHGLPMLFTTHHHYHHHPFFGQPPASPFNLQQCRTRYCCHTSALPLPCHSSPPRSTPSTPTVISGNNEHQPTDCLVITTRIRERTDVETRGREVMLKVKRKMEKVGQMEGRNERKEATKAGRSKPPPPPPPSNHESGQEYGDKHRKQRPRRHRHCRRCQLLANAPAGLGLL
jgi:hypothetical protein